MTSQRARCIRRASPWGSASASPSPRIHAVHRGGLLALIVALVGIYSSVAYAVGQRTHEFGVRVALGAQLRDVLNQVLGEGIRVVAIGVGIGLLLSIAAARLVRALLFGVEASDPSAMLLASCTLLLTAVLAALVPAWRAARVDPVAALRAD